MKIFLTGGCGFIGSAAVRYLIENGHEVLNIDKLTYAGDLRTVAVVADNAGYQFLQADITDKQAMNDAMHDFQPDAVLHLAAESHVDRSIDGPSVFIDTNIAGTSVLPDAALAYWRELSSTGQAAFKFVHVSTNEVYGSLGETGFFCRANSLRPKFTLFGQQGGIGSSGSCLATNIWPADDGDELF